MAAPLFLRLAETLGRTAVYDYALPAGAAEDDFLRVAWDQIPRCRRLPDYLAEDFDLEPGGRLTFPIQLGESVGTIDDFQVHYELLRAKSPAYDGFDCLAGCGFGCCPGSRFCSVHWRQYAGAPAALLDSLEAARIEEDRRRTAHELASIEAFLAEPVPPQLTIDLSGDGWGGEVVFRLASLTDPEEV